MSDSATWTRNGITDTRLVRNFSYVNGKWTAGDDSQTLAVTNPADGLRLGEVASLSADQARAAVDAAQAAFADWSMTLPQDRSALLRRWFDLMIENREDLARIMVLEQGKARVGFLPPDILLYAAAALESIDRQTADSARPSTGRAAGDGWVKATQRRLDGYLERRVTLLDPQGLNSVRPVVRGDGEIELKSRVLRVSRFLRNRFEEWGVFND